MYRFYVKRIGNQYHLLNGKEFFNIGPFSIEQMYGCTSQFAEIWINMGFRPGYISNVEPLDVNEVKPAALAAADDHNEQLMIGKPKAMPRKSSQEFRELFQEYIDRSHLYGTSFEKEFEDLLGKFPIRVSVKDQFYRNATL